ncbi:MAG: IPTL-CTERM sorting domain-containing protein [Bacteroidota bacterium]
MKSPLISARKLRFGAVIAFLITFCSATPTKAQLQFTENLYATIDNSLVHFGFTSTTFTTVGTFSPGLKPLGKLTWHINANLFLGIANYDSAPKLVSIDRSNAVVNVIAPLTLAPNNTAIQAAQGLAYNRASGVLYGVVDTLTNSAARILVTIDPNSGVATKVADISGTCQNDIDGMAFGNGLLHALDACANPNTLYSIDINTGAATILSNTTVSGDSDLSYEIFFNRLIGHTTNRQFVQYNYPPSPFNPSIFGPTHTAADFNGVLIDGLAYAVPPPVTSPVPTLSQWGLILLGLSVMCLGAIRMFRMRYGKMETEVG